MMTVLNLGILLIVSVTRIDGFHILEVNGTSSDNCWYTANFTCIKTMIMDPIKDIWKKKEIRIFDSVVIEKISKASSQDDGSAEAKDTEGNRSVGGDAEQMMDNVGRFMKSHAVRVDLWNFAKLTVQRSEENHDNIEIIFDMNRGTPGDNEEGK
jgi:hypothetical protein